MKKIKNKKIEDERKIEILKQGKASEFWRLIIEILEESKEDIQKKQDSEDFTDLTAEKYKFLNELFKAKKDLIETLKNTPDNVISWLEKPQNNGRDFDPFFKE